MMAFKLFKIIEESNIIKDSYYFCHDLIDEEPNNKPHERNKIFSDV